MLRSDARGETPPTLNNLKPLNIDMISLIEKEIDYYDMISLVFLLYEVPETALQRLIIYQRVCEDVEGNGTNLLHDWVQHMHHQPTWTDKFLEALVTCQLYSIIRKMGLDVATIKRKYQWADEKATSIHPMKKALYKLCENMNSTNLKKLTNTLKTYDIDVTDYETCELIILDLMCRRFITLRQSANQIQTKDDPGIEKLAKILDNFTEPLNIGYELRRLEEALSDKTELNSPIITSTPSIPRDNNQKENDKLHCKEFSEVFELFNQLNLLEDEPAINLKSDTMFPNKSIYEIINPKNVGVCLIINQEIFHPSKDSIEGNVEVNPLADRKGSSKDKEALKQTMADLNFEVITKDNLDHNAMFETIEDVLKYRVHKDHSMFMLCILSHGTRGHVYAANSVKVKVEDIESLLDSGDATHLQNKPKLVILQACQVKDDEPHFPFVADSPRSSYKYYIEKSDIIIYWATAPNYKAFRHEKIGTIFIQMLCKIIKDCAKKEHVNDMFTIVNYKVQKICLIEKQEQLPKVEHTLVKKLYLQIPEIN